ncbi:hypothetical protein GGTG_03153 [Gaeumannomyces tritici R3-111a-1]|uniref:Glucosidase 2 subunit beta n=1 Tax=Gaeumannomyces tritici (strain R3-111a-1) TaxID=644352 RepID=J3NPE5_GAET3|nr:hypothetical protein GGTG_03153 [Gaeumannomyces tritici R3-111a-1]EJT78050.1 hypothetical protein GGTG_03153 [Gaeumannomyces tritici R3-111a-1]
MRHQSSVVLLGTVAGISLAGASGVPRGVGPDFVRFYEPKDRFTCINHPTVVLKPSQVNDNSCDCPDGSDEPGTAACAYLDSLSPPQPLEGSLSGTTNTANALPGFWCENKGHEGTYVPFSFVNDGVCDYELCCDGSEEYGGVGGIKCANKCDAIGKEHRRIQEERRLSQEKAMKRRRTLVKEAKELRRQVEARITKLESEIAGLETKEKDLRTKFEEVERSEKGKIVKREGGKGGRLSVLLGMAKSRVAELRNTLDKVLEQRDDLHGKVEELEGILAVLKEKWNPNFNDEGAKAAVRAWEDYEAKHREEKPTDLTEDEITQIFKEDSSESGIDWKQFEEEEITDTDILYSFEAYLPDFMKEFLHSKLLGLRVWMIENGLLADNPNQGESHIIKAAREALDAVSNDISNKRNSLSTEQTEIAKDFGTDDVFRALKDKCVSVESGEYEYELCWMDKTTQKSKKGHGNTSMGNFDKLDFGDADEEERADGKGLGRGRRVVLRYENGQHCWNGPSRRTDVWLACAEKDELWRVSEAEKCVYRMEVGTPAVCEDSKAAPGDGARAKDEL